MSGAGTGRQTRNGTCSFRDLIGLVGAAARIAAEQNVTRFLVRKTSPIDCLRVEAMSNDDADGVFGADFGLDSDEEEKSAKEEKEKRTFQSEEDFLQQKREWIPKVETKQVSCALFVGRR
jgi:hypothetical protein